MNPTERIDQITERLRFLNELDHRLLADTAEMRRLLAELPVLEDQQNSASAVKNQKDFLANTMAHFGLQL